MNDFFTEKQLQTIVAALAAGDTPVTEENIYSFVTWCSHALAEGAIVRFVLDGTIGAVNFREDGDHTFVHRKYAKSMETEQ